MGLIREQVKRQQELYEDETPTDNEQQQKQVVKTVKVKMAEGGRQHWIQNHPEKRKRAGTLAPRQRR